MNRQQFLARLPELTTNYEPEPELLERIKSVSLLIIIGPSGVGKSSVIKQLDIPYVVSDTTRKPRPEEKVGADIHFLTDYEQIAADIQAGHFLQVATGSGGDFYATRIDAYPVSGWAVMPVIAHVVPSFRRLGFAQTISAFITPPSYQEWMRRLDNHALQAEQTESRLAEARRSFNFALSDQLTNFILNDDLPAAAAQIRLLIAGKADSSRDQLARQAAEKIIDSIN